MDRDTKKMLKETSSFSAVGLEMGLSVVIGYLFGHWLDGKFGTGHVLTYLFLFFGLGAAFMAVYRVYRAARNLADEDREKQEHGEEPR